MATQGILNTTAWESKYGYTRYIELSWKRTAIDVINQTSTIKWTLTGRGTFSGQVQCAPFTVIIDGNTEYQSLTRIGVKANQQIASGTKTIKHNSDGTKTFAASVYAAIYSSSANHSGSASFTLDTVGMAQLTKYPDFNDEESPAIEYFNPVGNAITSLQACISLTGADADIPYRDIPIASGSYIFNLTAAERQILRAATQGSNSRKVRFYLRNVVEGNIYFSWKEVNFSVINAKPIIEAGVIDTNSTTTALTGSPTTLIRGYSTASASMSAYPQKEATISTRRIEHNGNFITADVGIYQNVSGNVFSFIATDSRGNTTTETIVAPMIDYVIPTANIDATQQMDTTGYYNLRCSGNYYNDTFGYTSAAVANSLTVKYRYKTQGGSYSSWYAISAIIKENTYSATTTITGLDYRTTYVIQCQVVDKLNTIYSAETTIRSLPVFHWSETDFTFEVPVHFNAGTSGATAAASDTGNDFSGDVSITGDLRLKGSGNYGNTLYFGDGSYAYIREATDDDLTIKAADINIDGELYLNGSQIHYGSWTPTLSSSGAVSSYSVRQGWYQRVGNVVSVGWQIKATINSGYNTTNVVISGLPYTPSYAAFGGGIAHNIYLTGGFCFEGYAAGTDGNITLRGQPCNNTSAANLNITSSAYYPTGSGNVMTLGGSITYFTND